MKPQITVTRQNNGESNSIILVPDKGRVKKTAEGSLNEAAGREYYAVKDKETCETLVSFLGEEMTTSVLSRHINTFSLSLAGKLALNSSDPAIVTKAESEYLEAFKDWSVRGESIKKYQDEQTALMLKASEYLEKGNQSDYLKAVMSAMEMAKKINELQKAAK